MGPRKYVYICMHIKCSIQIYSGASNPSYLRHLSCICSAIKSTQWMIYRRRQVRPYSPSSSWEIPKAPSLFSLCKQNRDTVCASQLRIPDNDNPIQFHEIIVKYQPVIGYCENWDRKREMTGHSSQLDSKCDRKCNFDNRRQSISI